MLRLSLCGLLAGGALACGKINTVESTLDAAPDDSDAAPGPPGLVTVQIDGQFDDATYGDPLVGLPVLFFGPDHELIAEEETDEDGFASATVPPDSVVLILAEIDTDEHAILGVFDVQPGDEIVFASPEPSDDVAYPVLGNMTIDMPDSGDPDVNYYQADNGCTSTTSLAPTSEVVLPFNGRCVDDGGEFDVVVRAFDVDDNVLDAGSGHFTFADTGAVAVDSWNGTQDVELPVTGIPDELRNLTVSITPTAGLLHFGTVSSDAIEPAEDSYDLSVGGIDGFGDALDVSIIYRPIQSTLSIQRAYYRLEPGTGDLPLPLDTELLPWYGLPTFDSSARTVHWSFTTGGGAPDGQYVYLFGAPKNAPDATTGMLAVVPPGWTSVTVPELPEGYEEFQLDDFSGVIAFVEGIDVSGHDGYDIREAGILPFLWASDDFPRDPDVGFYLKYSGVVGK